jgi:exopolyphosphatase/guanosine-5'-triphosphate,3'-diphosphate pyrophosphatase
MSSLAIQDEPHRPLALDPERVQRNERRPFAVVDIGSNSVRLVVYEQLGRAPFPRFNEKSLCRLGASLNETGDLSAESIHHTVQTMRRFRAIADAMGVSRIDVIATEAVRRAANGSQLVASIAQQARFAVRVLTGAEEAYYSALGVISGFYRPNGLVGDMGGGSLELAEVADDRAGMRSVSLPLGSLPVQALLGNAKGDAKQQVDSLLKEKLPPALTKPVFYAVGGGWRAFAQVHMAANAAPVRVVHGYTLDADEARRFAKSIWRLPPAKVAALPGVPTRRVETLPAAALALDRVLKRLAPERVVFSALGLREGWLYAQLTTDQQYLDPLVEGAQAVGIPQSRVPAFAPALVAWTDDLFPGETPPERRLRVAACALSDISWRDHASVKAAEGFRRLVQFPLIGLDHTERVFLGAVVHARYAGRPNDPALEPAIDLLPAGLRRRALILGRVLLLGYRVSGGVPDILASARLRIETDKIRLEISKTARVPDSEVVKDRLELVARAVGARRTEIAEEGPE